MRRENTRCHFSGTSGKWMCPASAIVARALGVHPSCATMATKSSFTSGIRTPAWFRMNATAKQRLDAGGAPTRLSEIVRWARPS